MYEESKETSIIFFILLFLGTLSVFQAFFGFSLFLFVGTIIASAGLSLLQPRAALASIVILTVLFERFFTLQPIIIGESTYKLYPLDVLLAVVLVVTFANFFRKNERFLWQWPEWLMAGFMALVTLLYAAGLFGGNEASAATAFSTWKNYVFYGLLFYLVGYYFRTPADLWYLARVFLVSVAVALVFLAIGLLRGGGLWTEFTPLSTSGVRLLAFPHAFYYSLALIGLVLSYPWWKSARYRGALFLFSGLLAIGVAGSLMRHLWLGLALTLPVILFFLKGRARTAVATYGSYFAFLIFFGVAAAWFTTTLLPWQEVSSETRAVGRVVSERLWSLGSDTDESFVWREAVWASALARFWEAPLWGIGFGASVPVEIGDYRQYVEIRNMHNSWLALLIQTGLIGTGILAFLVAFLFFRLTVSARRSQDEQVVVLSWVTAGLILFQCLVFFSQPYLETNLLGIFFWLTLGIAATLLRSTDAHS